MFSLESRMYDHLPLKELAKSCQIDMVLLQTMVFTHNGTTCWLYTDLNNCLHQEFPFGEVNIFGGFITMCAC